MYDVISIGIDQSYARTGISIACDGKLKVVSSIDFKKYKDNTRKRNELEAVLNKIIQKNKHKAKEIKILCERIRLYSQGFINQNYLMSTGALVAKIIDTAYAYNIPVYSVDTRSWKSQVIGSSKAAEGDQKLATIKFVNSLGFDVSYRDNKGIRRFDDDASDSGCIALYAFIPEENQKLKLEK